MYGDKIDSKDKLAMELCEAFDMCAENSYPVIDLTDQKVSMLVPQRIHRRYLGGTAERGGEWRV